MAKHRWVHIDTVEDGVRVLALRTKSSNTRKRIFGRFRAHVQNHKIYVRTAREWWASPGLRAHERTHVRQDRWKHTDELYSFFDDTVGYYFNPFEWHAHAVGATVATGSFLAKLFRG